MVWGLEHLRSRNFAVPPDVIMVFRLSTVRRGFQRPLSPQALEALKGAQNSLRIVGADQSAGLGLRTLFATHTTPYRRLNGANHLGNQRWSGDILWIKSNQIEFDLWRQRSIHLIILIWWIISAFINLEVDQQIPSQLHPNVPEYSDPQAIRRSYQLWVMLSRMWATEWGDGPPAGSSHQKKCPHLRSPVKAVSLHAPTDDRVFDQWNIDNR